jgi:hypothetical protein
VEQIKNGGLAAIIYGFLHLGFSQFEVRDISATEALRDQKKSATTKATRANLFRVVAVAGLESRKSGVTARLPHRS